METDYPITMQSKTSLSALSGGDGLMYMEFEKNRELKPQKLIMSTKTKLTKPIKQSKKHILFRKKEL